MEEQIPFKNDKNWLPKILWMIYQKAVAKKKKAVCFDVCNKWVYTECSNINTCTYRKLQKSEAPLYCKGFLKKVDAIYQFNKQYLKQTIWRKRNGILKPFSRAWYMYIKQIFYSQWSKQFFSNDKNESLYLYLNVSSSPYHCHELSVLINNLKMKLKTISISYSRTRTTSIQY